MKPTQPLAELIVPDGTPWDAACKRTTHVVIAAHPDDVKFMAWHAILECFQQPDKALVAVIVTDGRGSLRRGAYAGMTDEQMPVVRLAEQKKAALGGGYALHVIALLRALPAELRPGRVVGCEMWRSLDWLGDADKCTLDVSGREHLTTALMRVFDSQIAGGKRYDLATTGRKRSNETYAEHGLPDHASAIEFAMDLTPLVRDADLDVQAYVAGLVERFGDDVTSRIRRLRGR